MKKPLFTGTCTALVTPFLDGKVNYPMLEQLLKRQMDAGIRAIVLSGTTGESATLSDEEKKNLIRRAKAYTGSDCMIIAGTGSNNTEHALRLSADAQNAGADGLLVISPYCNKATADGLIAHYLTIACRVDLPIIVYNVPSRTGMDIPVCVYDALSAVQNIAGVKEASTDLSKFLAIRTQTREPFPIWSGNDDLTVPIMALGGQGVISVVSNLVPEWMNELTLAAQNGDFDTAADLQSRLFPLTQALFSEVNPIPVKAGMKLAGFDCGSCRLPLTDAGTDTIKKIRKALEKLL